MRSTKTKDLAWYEVLQLFAQCMQFDPIQQSLWLARPTEHHESLATVVWC